jgi:hypothetical protein
MLWNFQNILTDFDAGSAGATTGPIAPIPMNSKSGLTETKKVKKFFLLQQDHGYQKKSRLLEFYYVPLLVLPLTGAFLWWPLTVLNRQTRQAVCVIKGSFTHPTSEADFALSWPAHKNKTFLLFEKNTLA